ncbi:hypothetical protein WA026_009183 [Henosepilachna vigintioctopunctata]|uniref:Uncharacterized protein n=1 Tax=Henosepilachna vigintioctopunctata TaxID=420089 RepID=A0AAW1UWS2_9CUCU
MTSQLSKVQKLLTFNSPKALRRNSLTTLGYEWTNGVIGIDDEEEQEQKYTFIVGTKEEDDGAERDYEIYTSLKSLTQMSQKKEGKVIHIGHLKNLKRKRMILQCTMQGYEIETWKSYVNEAVIISSQGSSFADTVKKVDEKVKNTAVAETVKSMSKTKQGELLINVKKGKGSAEPILKALKTDFKDKNIREPENTSKENRSP